MPNEGQAYSHSGHSRDVNASQNIGKVIRYENNRTPDTRLGARITLMLAVFGSPRPGRQ